jgi:pyruvate/2-oxoglutarate dehydrogenase complex dihydrolipoamide acyltransferase (E2) component
MDLTTVEGTGTNGRITVGDVENAAKEEDGEGG